MVCAWYAEMISALAGERALSNSTYHDKLSQVAAAVALLIREHLKEKA